MKKGKMNVGLSVTLAMSTLFPGAVIPAYAAEAHADAKVSVNFEDDKLNKWQGNGDTQGYTFEISTEQACTKKDAKSKKSLKVANKQNSWENPQYMLGNYKKGDTVQVSAMVYNAGDTTQQFGFSAHIIDGSNEYPWVGGSTEIKGGQWGEIAGEITFDGTPDYLYIEPRDGHMGDFYVDDIEMNFTKGAQAPSEEKSEEKITYIANNTFETDDQTQEQWIINGEQKVTLENVTSQAHTGKASIKVSGRTKKYDGPKMLLKDKVELGKNYHYSAWVYQETGEEKMAYLTAHYENPSPNYITIATVTLPSGQWTKIEGEYAFPKDAVGEYDVYIESSSEVEGIWENNKECNISNYDTFYMDDAEISTANELPALNLSETPALKDFFDFPVGIAVKDTSYLNDGRSSELIKHHFDSITAENEMKPSYIQPEEGKFQFENTNKYIEFVEAHEGMRLRGHTLVWHIQNPEWLFKGLPEEKTEKREALLKRVEAHITACMLNAGDKVDVWDVVNEAISDDSPYGMRNTEYYQIIGEDYVEQIFRIADKVRKEHNLDVKLYYNDYNNLEIEGKRQGILDFVTKLKKDNVPIDGVGYQGHVGNDFGNISDMEKTLRGFLDLGLEVEITELDITVYPSHQAADAPITEEQLIKQAYRYKEVADLLKALNKEYPQKITGLTMWGLKDDDTWLNYFDGNPRTDVPLLFDKNHQPKYAYWALVDRLDKVPSIIQVAKSFKETPTVDGEKEGAWDLALPMAIKDNTDKVIGEVRSLWDQEHVYLWIDIINKEINNKDSIEVFIDPDNSRDDFNESKDLKGIITLEEGLKKETFNTYVKKTEQGYKIEVAIPIAKVSDNIGLDLSVHMGEQVANFNDKQGNQGKSTASYARISLENPKYIETCKGKPIIDGEIDKVWDKAEKQKTEVVSSKETATGVFRTLWSGNTLYVLAEVKDSHLSAKENAAAYEQDSIEVFIDENNNKTTFYQPDDTQYRVNYLNVPSFLGSNCEAKYLKSATKETKEGYIVEAAITFNSMDALKENQVIGIDFQVNDDATGTGKRSGTATWNDTVGNGWQSTAVFGLAKLVEK